MVNGDSIPLAPTGANREIQERDPELRLPDDTNNPNKENVKICDDLARIAVDVRFTLLGPDGPTEPQITVAMTSKDSSATDQNDSRLFAHFPIHLPKDGLSFRPT